jgi:effector-binding domain-containing protein
MEYKCEVLEKTPQPTVSIRTRTSVQDLPQVMGTTYARLGAYLGELGECPAGAPFAAYYNMDMQDLDVEIGLPVVRRLPSSGDIQAGEIPGGKFAGCQYNGPYQDIGPAYEALSQFVHQNGRQPSGVAYEYYLNDPAETKPEELMTYIVFPLLES